MTEAAVNSILRLLPFFQRAGLAQYDIFPIPKATIEDIDIDLVKEYFQVVHHQKLEGLKIQTIDLLKNLEILTDYEGAEVGSVAGLLLFGKNPQRHLPQASISLVNADSWGSICEHEFHEWSNTTNKKQRSEVRGQKSSFRGNSWYLAFDLHLVLFV